MNTSPNVVTAGHICLDITPTFQSDVRGDLKKVFMPGKLLKVGDAVIGTGGSVSNTGIALSKLGNHVAYMSTVGDDGFGEIIVEKMSAYGNVDGFSYHPDVGSSYSVILAVPGVDRIILHNPGCNDYFTAEQIHWDMVARTRLFHLGYPPIMRSLYVDNGAEMAKILQKVKSKGVSTSVDMALPDPDSEAGRMDWRNWLKNVLPSVDIFMPSIEEALLFWDRQRWQHYRNGETDFVDALPMDVYQKIADGLIDMDCGIVILKAGHRGLYLKTADQERISRIELFSDINNSSWKNRELWGNSYQTDNIQSATGAGDSAVAGILTAILRGKRIEQILQFGNCLGLQNLQGLDTVSSIRNYEETEALLQTLQTGSSDFLDASWQKTSFHGVYERK